jgi:hypothetical protein
MYVLILPKIILFWDVYNGIVRDIITIIKMGNVSNLVFNIHTIAIHSKDV